MEPECDQHFRESLEELRWPVMARSLRQYLTRVAENDGALIRNRPGALEELLGALGPHASETDAVRDALALLVKKGVLLADATSVFVRTKARVPRSVKPSTQRVRKYRERLRLARQLSTATTADRVASSCDNGRTIESLVEIKLIAELLPISTSMAHPTTAKCVSNGKQ